MATVRPTSSVADMLRGWARAPRSPERVEQRSSSARIGLTAWYGTQHETPGGYPYTRGRTDRGYHDALWVMGQYSGYGTARETNERFRRLLDSGQTGLSVALDLPTQMGLDSSHPLADGEIGRVGVPLDTVDDLFALLHGLPLERVTQIRTTANAIGPIFAAFMIVALEELAVDPTALRLLLQNDPLKEFSARGTYIFPPEPSLRLAVDVMEHFAAVAPHWEPIEFCGYHIRDAGGTAVDEVAIATANGIAYLDEAVNRGIEIERIAHSLFLFLAAGVDVFEEAAKMRAARRIWAKLLHERYGVDRRHAAVNLFVYTLGGALTAQTPLTNVVRVAYETLGAVLGGVQTMATSSYDEALGLPSLEAAQLALRTQQVAAYESGATKVVDPLGGSYYVEALTDELERRMVDVLIEIAEAGGAVPALESGLLSARIGDAAFEYQREIELGIRPIVGVNVHVADAESVRGVFRLPPELQSAQLRLLASRRAARDDASVEGALARLSAAVAAGHNSVPPIVEAARARATIGEIAASIGAVVGFHEHAAVRL